MMQVDEEYAAIVLVQEAHIFRYLELKLTGPGY
jgi:hypothetical protein